MMFGLAHGIAIVAICLILSIVEFVENKFKK
mgnify:CR=1 FL=1